MEWKLLLKSFRRFSEEERPLKVKGEKIVRHLKFGHWYEWFKDEGRPKEKGIRVERCQIIAIDGVEQKRRHYTVNDI